MMSDTSNVTNIILLIASSSQSSMGNIGVATGSLGRGGGGGSLCVTSSASLLRGACSESVCVRGTDGGETSGFGGAGEGAEFESFASRFCRT